MDGINKNIPQTTTEVGGKEITNTFPLPLDVLTHLFSLLPVSGRCNFAKTSYFHLFVFYAVSVLKENNDPSVLCQQGMSSVLNFIAQNPRRINDEYVPLIWEGRKYLADMGIVDSLLIHKIKNGLAIKDALENGQALLQAFQKEFDEVRLRQNSDFEIESNSSFERRIEIAEAFLSKNHRSNELDRLNLSLNNDDVFKGVLILEELSNLDHPLAEEAKAILNKWSSDSKNRVWLITHCAEIVARSLDSYGRDIQEIFTKQIDILLQEIQTCKKQGDKAAAKKQIVQLINLGIALEFLGVVEKGFSHEPITKLCSALYQQLLDSPAVDDPYKEEIKIYKARSDHGSLWGKTKTIENYTNGQPQGIFFPYRYDKHAVIPNVKHAERIQKSISFFQNLVDAGCFLLEGDLDAQKNLVKQTFEKAGECAIFARRSSPINQDHLNAAIELYEFAEKAGHPEAKLEREKLLHFELLVSQKNDAASQFELGKIYLDSAKELFLNGKNLQAQKMLLKAQKELENAANNGSVEAAVLVAQHYSTFTPHQPKFTSNFFNDSNAKAMELMNMAIRSGFESAKDTIYENEIPNYLKKILEQTDPTALEIIFNLSEQYENVFLFKTEDDQKLANLLLKIAVEGGNSSAITKLAAQQDKLEQKLKIKLERQIKAQEEQQKNEPSINWNFSLFGLPNKLNEVKETNNDKL